MKGFIKGVWYYGTSLLEPESLHKQRLDNGSIRFYRYQ